MDVATDAHIAIDKSSRPYSYIYTHTALRGVAAFFVVAYHLQFGAPHYLAIETATPFFRRGYLMVDLFFILSGFIISYTTEAAGAHAVSRSGIYHFYVTRVARIYPLHVFCLGTILIVATCLSALRSWHHSANLANIDSSAIWSFIEELFLIQAWIPDAPRWNIPSWSISAELFAYLLFPITLLLRHHVRRFASTLLLVLPLVFYVSISLGAKNLDIITGLAILRCLSGFAVGMFLCENRHFVGEWSNNAVTISQFFAVAAIIVVLMTPCPDPAIIPFFALLVIATWQDRGPLRFLLLHRVFLRAGELSYSVYLTHVGIISLISYFWYALIARITLHSDLARTLNIVLSFTLIILVSRWTYIHVEKKGREIVIRLLTL